MTSTINSLLASVNIPLMGQVQWGQKIPSQEHGIYIIALTDDPNQNNNTFPQAPLDMAAIMAWLAHATEMTLDKQPHPTTAAIAQRLQQFWLPSETIIYIGKADQPLRKRVGDFYNHKLGRKGPHAGGHWLKTLSNINELQVYYAECDQAKQVETALLEQFAANANNNIPFANLTYSGGRKKHGIGKAKR